MQISRLFEIVYLLLDKKCMTAQQLADRFEVSVRTIYRDIDTLSQAGIPVYASRGKGGGIRLTDNFVLNKSVLSEEEQNSILSALYGMNAMQPGQTGEVLEKLSALFGGRQYDWIEIDFSSWDSTDRISRSLALLKEAIFSRSVISFDYCASDGNTTHRQAEPLRLVFRGYDWYLYAWCRTRNDYRFFKLSRMDCLAMLEERFERSAPALPKRDERHQSIYPARTRIEVRAKVAPELAFRIYDEFSAAHRRQMPDGTFLVQITMPEDDWLYHYLMTFGPGLEVLGPERVRNETKRRLEKALANYNI